MPESSAQLYSLTRWRSFAPQAIVGGGVCAHRDLPAPPHVDGPLVCGDAPSVYLKQFAHDVVRGFSGAAQVVSSACVCAPGAARFKDASFCLLTLYGHLAAKARRRRLTTPYSAHGRS